MRYYLKTTALSCCLTAFCLGSVSTAMANDDLFSEVAMESVFAASVSKKAEESKKELEKKTVKENRLKAIAALFESSEPKQKTVPQPTSLSKQLIGRWSATLSGNQIFAIELAGKQKFNLVHLNQGKATVSSGSFLIAGNQLTLKSEGASPLTSEITLKSSDLFQMKLGTIRLNFKRAR